jgi:hypothetical protein
MPLAVTVGNYSRVRRVKWKQVAIGPGSSWISLCVIGNGASTQLSDCVIEDCNLDLFNTTYSDVRYAIKIYADSPIDTYPDNPIIIQRNFIRIKPTSAGGPPTVPTYTYFAIGIYGRNALVGDGSENDGCKYGKLIDNTIVWLANTDAAAGVPTSNSIMLGDYVYMWLVSRNTITTRIGTPGIADEYRYLIYAAESAAAGVIDSLLALGGGNLVTHNILRNVSTPDDVMVASADGAGDLGFFDGATPLVNLTISPA